MPAPLPPDLPPTMSCCNPNCTNKQVIDKWSGVGLCEKHLMASFEICKRYRGRDKDTPNDSVTVHCAVPG